MYCNRNYLIVAKLPCRITVQNCLQNAVQYKYIQHSATNTFYNTPKHIFRVDLLIYDIYHNTHTYFFIYEETDFNFQSYM